MSTKSKGTAKRRIEFDEEEPSGQHAMRWLAAGLAVLVVAGASWILFGGGGEEDYPIGGTAASADGDDAAAGGSYDLVRASWGSVAQPSAESLQPPPPPAEMTQEQRRQAQFAEEARQRWKGTEVFMRPR